MTKIMLFGHGGSGNRGCEAIVRGTASIIRKNISDVHITVVSNRSHEDIKAKIKNIDEVVSGKIIQRYNPTWFLNILTRKFIKPEHFRRYLYHETLKSAEKSDICVSIGGDNYCYDKPINFFFIHREIKKLNKKLVFWGGSIEPDAIDQEMADDLNSLDLIIARESITYQALLDRGIVENVFLHSDPAFTMQCQEIVLPEGWEDGAMVGINISPMVARYGQKESLDEAAVSLIHHIIEQRGLKVCLIPHVYWPNKNDYLYMQKYYNKFKDNDRVMIVRESYNATQLKYLISKCRFLIASRTHATIAGYSTCVPTLAIGYSVKAKGIARDIFGSEKEWVLPVQSLEGGDDLVVTFENLYAREKELRNHLKQKMPDYIKSAWMAGERLNSLAKSII